MPLQDLTPQLRTRLRRVEKVVGWFVILAIVMLIVGFGYYLYSTAHSRGWFVTKINFATGINDASGLSKDDEVKLMGFPVGKVTGVLLNPPEKTRGVIIFFNIRETAVEGGTNYFRYVFWDSKVRVIADFLGHRYLEIEKGKPGLPAVTNVSGKLMVLKRIQASKKFNEMYAAFRADPDNNLTPPDIASNIVISNFTEFVEANRDVYYTNATEGGFTTAVDPTKTNYFWVPPIDAPALSDRLEAVAGTVEKALPNILNITNQLNAVLSNANLAAVQAKTTLQATGPTLTNLAAITGNLKNPNGALGAWLIPTNIAADLDSTLRAARETLKTAQDTVGDTDTNITMLATNLDQTLTHLADLTSNLAWQVSVNTNLISEISTTIVHTDDLIQGLKKEWYLRGPFKKKKTEPVPPPKK